MAFLIGIILVGVIIFIVRLAKKITSANQLEAEKIVTTFYEIIKFDENKETFKTIKGKEIKLTREKNRLINIAILFALVEFAFKEKIPNTSIVDIVRWFSLLARESGYPKEELYRFRGNLMEKGTTKERIVYSDFLKELRTVTHLFKENLDDSKKMQSQDSVNKLGEVSTSIFISDINLVLSDFLPKKDFPKSFGDLA